MLNYSINKNLDIKKFNEFDYKYNSLINQYKKFERSIYENWFINSSELADMFTNVLLVNLNNWFINSRELAEIFTSDKNRFINSSDLAEMFINDVLLVNLNNSKKIDLKFFDQV